MTYCTTDDLYARLGERGILFAADDDADGACSAGESSRAITASISAASNEIDAALAAHWTLPLAESCEWLLHRAVDLACEYLLQRRGAEVPRSIAEGASRTREWLEKVHAGSLVPPGLATALSQRDSSPSRGLPRLSNPSLVHDRPSNTREHHS